jgi:hypothetical protein
MYVEDSLCMLDVTGQCMLRTMIGVFYIYGIVTIMACQVLSSSEMLPTKSGSEFHSMSHTKPGSEFKSP